jgi:Spy/CpxP family protein refolding chaperone
MMRFTRIPGVLIVTGLLAAAGAAWVDLAVGAGRPGAVEQLAAKKNKQAPQGPPSAMVSQGFFGDDLDKIDATCTLTDAQKTRLRQIKADLDKALETYDKNAAPKQARIDELLAKLSTDKKDAKAASARKELEAMKAQIAAERENLSQTHTRRMFAVLTSDQKAKWNTPLLTDGMTAEFSVVALDGKQIERLSAFCAQQARALSFPIDPFNPNDKQLNTVKMQVYNTILTPAQQADYRKIKTPPPPPVKGAKGAGQA